MKTQATPPDIARVCERIEALGLKPHIIPGEQRTAIGITGNSGPIDAAEFEHLPGVAEAIRVSKPYKLVSRETKPENTIVLVNGVAVGGPEIVLCGGPCSVESRQQILDSARAVKAAGGELLRGGAYKPRLVYASSAAVFGAPFPDGITDEFHLTPLTSYGTQKAIGELLLADYSRRGFFDGVGLRFPTICVRPGDHCGQQSPGGGV